MGARRQVGGGYPVAPKVKAATASAAFGGLILWGLSTYAFHGSDVPEPVQAAVYAAVPGVLAFFAGLWARHQQRDSDAPIVPVQPPTL